MAPSPQHDSEPKAPDKSTGAPSQTSADARNPPMTSSATTQVAEKKNMDKMDDGQLRALLDEAFAYKSPKDREGKSLLFNELLEEVEEDEKADAGWSRRREGRACRRRRGERALSHTSSLQDLVQALAGDHAQRRRVAPVSARAHHGGSLPSGVDTSFLMSEEPVRSGGADYIATVRCVNPPPLGERRVSAGDSIEMQPVNRNKVPCSSVTYTSRATLDINSSGSRALTTTTCSNQVDSGIEFGCITTPAVVTSCNTTASATAPCPSVESKPHGVITTSINGLASLSRNYGATGSTSADEFKKSLDENGNALQSFTSPPSGSSQHKKLKSKKKTTKNETVIILDQIDGYQGNKDINELLLFIESDMDHRPHKKHHDDDKNKKRSMERKTKDKHKMQRANSLEELSVTKMEDLTHEKGKELLRKSKKERVSDGGDSRKNERRSWGDDGGAAYFRKDEEVPPPAVQTPAPAPPPAATVAPPAPPRDKKKKQNKSAEWPQSSQDDSLEFQTVTKKKRTRKRYSPGEARRADAGPSDLLYRKLRSRPATPDRRRKSAPPSDKSDSNDDLDSVHSLPAEPTTERCNVRPGSASSGGTPQASYADITRTRHNIPDLIESCNFYSDLEQKEEKPKRKKEQVCRSDSAPVETRKSPPKEEARASDADGYPALERPHKTLPRTKDKPKERRKVNSESTVTEKSKAVEVSAEPPDVILAPDRRPAVILLDEDCQPREMEGITFGFDVNEQLLNGEHKEASPAKEAPFPSSDEFPAINERRARGAGVVSVRAGRLLLRYLPPNPCAHHDNTHLHKLANYVNTAWEDIMKCPGGKVRYFSQ